jgi:hypothetical protein
MQAMSKRISSQTHPLAALGLTALGLMAATSQAHACQIKAVATDVIKVQVDGTIVQAFSCKDSEGQHLFIETRQALAATQAKGPAAELSFYKFTANGTAYVRRWQARDFVQTSDDRSAGNRPGRTLRTDRFVVRDVDGDGVVEAFISYTLPGQPPNPDDGKLLVYYKDRKFAIRGAVAQGPGDFGSRTLDPAFGTLPVAVQNYALTLWDTVALPRGLGSSSQGFTITQAQEH